MEAREGIWKRAVRGGKKIFGALSDGKYTTIAGTLVFFLLMSLVPFLFWLVLLFGGTGLDANEILELELFGWAKELLAYLKSNAEGATAGASIFFLAATLWSSTGFFYHLRRSGEIIYQYRRRKHGWKVRISAALFTVFLLLYFLVAGGLLIGANVLSRGLPAPLYYLTVYSLVLVFGFFAAWMLNLYVCPYRCKPSDVVLGSGLTAAAWLIASGAFAIYLRFTNRERLYGALALLIVFLIWLYWMFICFTVGVILNYRRMQVRELPHKTL